jgi:hypothetical protein
MHGISCVLIGCFDSLIFDWVKMCGYHCIRLCRVLNFLTFNLLISFCKLLLSMLCCSTDICIISSTIESSYIYIIHFSTYISMICDPKQLEGYWKKKYIYIHIISCVCSRSFSKKRFQRVYFLGQPNWKNWTTNRKKTKTKK